MEVENEASSMKQSSDNSEKSLNARELGHGVIRGSRGSLIVFRIISF